MNNIIYIVITLILLGSLYAMSKAKLDIGKIFIYISILIITIVSFIISNMIYNYQIHSNDLHNFGISDTSLKVILYFIIAITYVTILIIPLRKLSNKSIQIKVGPPGNKGMRGARGSKGDNGVCVSCTGGDLCYKKLLYNVTLTYNWWRKTKGLKPYSNDYIIRNEYLKSKIKRHCKSTEFSKIMTKYGANEKGENATKPNNNCDKLVSNCGAYDYMFRMWTIWILIILRYDKGSYFLESETLDENDFINMLENDKEYKFTEMFSNKAHGVDVSKNVSITYIPDKTKVGQMKYEETGIKDTFFKDPIENIDFLDTKASETPFKEIKKYDAWYWGSDKNSKPIVEIVSNMNTSNEAELCKTCYNGCDSSTNKWDSNKKKIKIKETNNFYKLFSTDNTAQHYDDITNSYRPFQQFGTEAVTFMRPYEYIDNNEHPKFRTYKPIGDVIFKSDQLKELEFESNTCKPDDIKYSEENIKRYVYKDITSILVSGDVVPPESFALVYTSINRSGINKNITAFTIWKPIPPTDYTALGYIIDTKPYKVKPIAPSKDIMVCVPTGLETEILVSLNSNKDEQFVENIIKEETNIESLWKSDGKTLEGKRYEPDQSTTWNENTEIIKYNETDLEKYYNLNLFFPYQLDTNNEAVEEYTDLSGDVKTKIINLYRIEKNKKNNGELFECTKYDPDNSVSVSECDNLSNELCNANSKCEFDANINICIKKNDNIKTECDYLNNFSDIKEKCNANPKCKFDTDADSCKEKTPDLDDIMNYSILKIYK